MLPALLPPDEAERLAALRTYGVLDTECEDSFDNIVRLASRLTSCPIALVSLVDAERQWFKARYGIDEREMHRDIAFCSHAIADASRPLIIPDMTKDPRFIDHPLVTAHPDLRFYAGVPLVNPEGYALGTLCILDLEPKEIEAEVLDTLVGLAQTVMTTLELRRALMRMQTLALTDRLTGLPNRAAFVMALVKAISRQRRDNQPFSLLYIDLDHFKQVNDQLGHGVGDHVLAEVADALRSCIRTEDIIARIGGDEFVALLQGGGDYEVAQIAERVRSTIKSRMIAGGWHVTASIGAVAFLQPPANESAALAAVDDLMYAAKVAGKDRICATSFRRPPIVSEQPRLVIAGGVGS